MIRRRTWLAYVSFVGVSASTSIVSARGFGLGPNRRSQAGGGTKPRNDSPFVVRAPNNAVAAIVNVVGGSHVRVQVDAKLTATQVVIGSGLIVDISQRILMKGKDPARARFLDDARNAVRVGINVRNALLHYDPSRQTVWKDNQRKWAHPFARKLLSWTRRLEAGLKGRRLRDEYHRVYLLEWGGAKIASNGNPSPSPLAKSATGPTAPNIEAYTAYIDDLVRTVAT